MRQYNSIKEQVPNALLMFRLGDFYELFFEDAVTAARERSLSQVDLSCAQLFQRHATISGISMPFS